MKKPYDMEAMDEVMAEEMDEPAEPKEPKGNPEELLSSIEEQLAKLRAAVC